jgi:hypothetical protein
MKNPTNIDIYPAPAKPEYKPLSRRQRILAVAGLAVSSLLLGNAAANTYNEYIREPSAYEPEPGDELSGIAVKPGDTVWEIASTIVDNDEDVEDMADLIQRDLTKIQGGDPTLYPGDTTRIVVATIRNNDNELETKYVGIGNENDFELKAKQEAADNND